MRSILAAVALSLVAGGAVAADWTGGYVGLGIGNADVDGPGAVDGSDTSYGAHLGFDYDFGDWVLGGELEYDRTKVTLGGGAAQMDSIGRFKIKGGYDFGPAMGYLLLGGANAKTNNAGSDTGYLYGLGFAAEINEQFTLGAELMRHDFKNFNNLGGDVKVDTINVRASFRF